MDNQRANSLAVNDLNAWYNQQQQQWLAAIQQEDSLEALALAQAEANWESERDYYHHAYLSSERY